MAPRGPSLPHGPRVPGEAALTVVAPLAHGEHAGVGRAGEEELAHVEGPQRAEPPALARAAEALQAAVGLGAHAGGAAAARCGARASRQGGPVCGGRGPSRNSGAPLGRVLRPGRAPEQWEGGREGGLCVGAQAGCALPRVRVHLPG